MLVLFAAALLSAQAVEAPAATPPAQAPAPSGAAAPASDRKVCKSLKPTGSRTSTGRVCRTQQEWDRLAAESRSELNRFVNDRSGIAPRDR